MSNGSAEYGGSEYGGNNQPPASALGGSLAQNIKKEIVLNFNALIQAGVINTVIELDLGKDPLTIEPANGYPFALVGMPIVTSDYEDSATNKRTYRFDTLIVTSYEYLVDKNEGLEFILDAIVNQFDNNFTLAGAAVATVLPVEVTAIPVATADKSLICFLATIRAQTLYAWNNPNP